LLYGSLSKISKYYFKNKSKYKRDLVCVNPLISNTTIEVIAVISERSRKRILEKLYGLIGVV